MSRDSCLLLVEGGGGSGKTSILAKLAQNISKLCPKPKCSLILRFIGTTQESSSVIPLMKSICQQISYNFMISMDNIPDDLIRLSFYFKQLLLNASKEQPVFIILDAINQLSGPPEAAIKLCWLTNELPKNVRVIISCVADEHCKEHKFLRKVIKEEFVLQVKTMDKLLA
ncbi:NACHT and WD repeat domain-containing protein 2-like protein, partial [Leptotrombidium deliense]